MVLATDRAENKVAGGSSDNDRSSPTCMLPHQGMSIPGTQKQTDRIHSPLVVALWHVIHHVCHLPYDHAHIPGADANPPYLSRYCVGVTPRSTSALIWKHPARHLLLDADVESAFVCCQLVLESSTPQGAFAWQGRRRRPQIFAGAGSDLAHQRRQSLGLFHHCTGQIARSLVLHILVLQLREAYTAYTSSVLLGGGMGWTIDTGLKAFADPVKTEAAKGGWSGAYCSPLLLDVMVRARVYKWSAKWPTVGLFFAAGFGAVSPPIPTPCSLRLVGRFGGVCGTSSAE